MNKWATERMAIEEGRRKEEKRRREEKWREEEERERLAEEEARIQGMEIGRAKLESLFSRWELLLSPPHIHGYITDQRAVK